VKNKTPIILLATIFVALTLALLISAAVVNIRREKERQEAVKRSAVQLKQILEQMKVYEKDQDDTYPTVLLPLDVSQTRPSSPSTTLPKTMPAVN
jgi:type II secretory pathway pseudopilin PulG